MKSTKYPVEMGDNDLMDLMKTDLRNISSILVLVLTSQELLRLRTVNLEDTTLKLQ
jgi:hypothetical protein